MSWADMADRMLGVAVRTFQAISVQYIPKSGPAYAIEAVFDKAHVQVDPDSGVEVSSTNPVLGVQISQMQGPIRKGERVNVNGTLYEVVDFRPDGVAGAILELNEA